LAFSACASVIAQTLQSDTADAPKSAKTSNSELAMRVNNGVAGTEPGSAPTQATNHKGTPTPAVMATASAGPQWADLSHTQQEALLPLAPGWNELSEVRKRKWIALARNFRHLSSDERAKLQERMTEWVALSSQARIQARLNYAQTNRLLNQDDKRAQWEAYKALSDEERQKLVSKAPGRPMGAAPPIKPVSEHKLTTVPLGDHYLAPLGQIHTGPHLVDMHTLLPLSSSNAHANDTLTKSQ
jgi:hypothetical protein